MSKPNEGPLGGLRDILSEALFEWGFLKNSPDREAMKERLLHDRNSMDTSRKVAEIAGLDIDNDRDARVLLNLLCLFAFTDLPKGAKAKSWKADISFIGEAARVARNIEGAKLSSLIAKMAPRADEKQAARYRKKIVRAFDFVTSSLPDMTRDEQESASADLDALRKFVARKHTRVVQGERGPYRRS